MVTTSRSADHAKSSTGPKIHYLVVLMSGLKLTVKSSLRKLAALTYLSAIGIIFGLSLGIGMFPIWLLSRLF